eukprot:1327271-Amorphochlora_amoeboformis.AAC.2
MNNSADAGLARMPAGESYELVPAWAARNKAFLGMLRRCADSVKDSNPNILSVFPHPRRTQSNTPSSRLLKEKGEKNPESTTKERTQKEASAGGESPVRAKVLHFERISISRLSLQIQ